jgi:hypothetical protein
VGSTVGGFGGLNMGTVTSATALGSATGGNSSFVGGFVGVNFAVVDPNIAFPTGTITQSFATAPATGGINSFVAGFAAINVGSLDQTYAAGLVTGGAGSTTGGLVASNTFSYTLPASIVAIDPPGTATNSYWDQQTTGQTTSAGGLGLNTSQLSSGLPVGFNPAAWGVAAGAYPFLPGLGPLPIPGFPVFGPILPPTVPPTVPLVVAFTPPSPTPSITAPSAQLVVQAFTQSNTSSTNVPGQLVDTRAVVQQQAQGGQQGGTQPQGAGAGTIPAAFGAPQIRLDVGEGRYFYLPPVGETRVVNNEAVLQLPCDVAQDALAAATRAVRVTVLSSQCLGASNIAVYRVQLGNGRTLGATLNGLAAHKFVVAAQANYVFRADQDPAGKGTTAREGVPEQYIVDKLNLTEVHRLVRGTNIPIAVIDSQIDAMHPDLAGVIAGSYDAAGTQEQPHAHGTGMAGAIGSHQKLIGVAPGAQITAIRAFSSKASTAESTTFNILKGLDYAMSNNVRIVNMSFAGPNDPSLERALKTASDKGLILIAAAGNAGPKSPPLYPAANPNVIAVTATDENNKVFSGANRGKHVAIAAPGVDILVPAPEGTYQLTTGTSVATAHISGVVALLLERNPKLTAADVRRILTQSAKKLGPPNDYGAGLVDPGKALELATPKSAALPPAPARGAVTGQLATAR